MAILTKLVVSVADGFGYTGARNRVAQHHPVRPVDIHQSMKDAQMAKYWVIGGTYQDTGFDKPIGEETKVGPFGSFEDAEKEWSKMAWQSVDDANSRYRIERLEEYWVVGGEYETTDFEKPVGGEEERHGPFATFKDAEKAWSKLAWQHVDNCNCRYRVVEG
jgi:hypothetical protein|tara:strand:- start:1650 stop:2135 length:486 start_codon:yes stop_codon:yes gene_type:complete